jgi:PTS system cellobiose-specific IIB component
VRILLVCFGGWSSSILAKRIEKGLASRGITTTIPTAAVETGMTQIANYDVLLVAPQVRHMVAAVKQAAAKVNKPVLEISMQEYAASDPRTLIDRILQAVEQHVEG